VMMQPLPKRKVRGEPIKDWHGRLRQTWNLTNRDAHGSRLHRTAIFLKIGGSGLDRTEKIFVVLK